MTHKYYGLLLAVSLVLVSVPAFAADVNFSSGNQVENSTSYVQCREAKRPPKDPNHPGFWDREWERSGLGKTGSGIKKTFGGNPFVGTKNFFQKQQDRYNQRQGTIK